MAIFAPGIRGHDNRPARHKDRNIVAMLSLTAMVDMFTVLAVFLLQNYHATGEAIEIEENVNLPRATETKEISPAHVVVVSPTQIMLNKEVLMNIDQAKNQQDWMLTPLFNRLQQVFQEAAQKRVSGLGAVRQVVTDAKPGAEVISQVNETQERRVTVQADKGIDMLTIKKVMKTVLDAGASQVNFAVIKNEKQSS